MKALRTLFAGLLSWWNGKDKAHRLPTLPCFVSGASADALMREYPRVQVWRDKRCPLCGSLLIGWKECNGRRNARGHRTGYQRLKVLCPFCERLTVADPYVPDNDNPPRPVTPNAVGWLRCPHCNSLFSLDDRGAFADGIHRKCGQRLIRE